VVPNKESLVWFPVATESAILLLESLTTKRNLHRTFRSDRLGKLSEGANVNQHVTCTRDNHRAGRVATACSTRASAVTVSPAGNLDQFWAIPSKLQPRPQRCSSMPAGQELPFAVHKKVDAAAPGVVIRSTYLGGGAYTKMSGTSMAAPHVTGAITSMAGL
jgi:hypothetical protein